MTRSRLSQSLLAAVAFSALGAFSALPSVAQTEQLFATYDDTNAAIVDNAPYGEIIGALTVSERGRTLVAYDIAHTQALPFFRQYVTYLESVPVETLNRNEQLAYWLNTRNVILLQAFAEERRISGYKRKRGTPNEPGAFWTEKRITVSGVELSLQDIEQDILFAGWNDPNIIYGLYQGIVGGPALPRSAFVGTDVHAQLAEAGRRFNTLPSNFRVRGSKVRISTYFDWYGDLAFGGEQSNLRQHLVQFAKADDVPTLNTADQYSRKRLSTSFERYQPRQAVANSGGVSGGGGGFGS
ncbi:MAG: DUF547 domain-containing protein [Pseudomonadota bacterium]